METDRIKDQVIEDEMKKAYLDYSMSVIVGRALPDVRDGLKPVHRRILYAMNDMGMKWNSAYKKSARIVGECFVKGTKVLTTKGLLPIENIKKGDTVFTHTGEKKVTELYIMPDKDLIKLTLNNGIEITSTKSQKFKIINENMEYEWKEAKDLSSNDYLVVRSHYPEINKEKKIGEIEGKAIFLNKNMAYLLGQLISDGWVEKGIKRGYGYRCGFGTTSETIIQVVSHILKKELGYTARIEQREEEYAINNGTLTVLKAFYTIRINNSKINEFLVSSFSLQNAIASTKQIPKQILASPKEVAYSFISGLIDGDGSIHVERNIIHYGSTSKNLIADLQIMLQHLGIFSSRYTTTQINTHTIKERSINHTLPFHYIEISSRFAKELASNLNLMEETKALRAHHLKQSSSTSTNSFDVIPFAGNALFGELSDKHLGSGWYKDSNGKKFRAGIKYPSGAKIRYEQGLKTKNLGRTQINEWGMLNKLHAIKSKHSTFLNEIYNKNIFFIKVHKTEDELPETTYDIQVDEHHEFLANGVVSHNCLGKYHPHGDSAVYDSLVRMAQSFSLRYPLIQGQGNFGCFTADTEVALADGRNISFKKLIEEYKEGKINYTFTIDKDRVKIAEIKKPRLTKKNQKLIKIVLDNGKEIRCTLDHKFMLKSGEYKEAKYLKSGESLMPLYTRVNKEEDNLKPAIKGYPMVFEPLLKKWTLIHHLSDEFNIKREKYYANEDIITLINDACENHKVSYTEILDYKEDVYDLTIDNTHNFALAAGVFVHNSVDGDSAAAMRYTEARMTKLSDELLQDIDKETVEFMENFDGSLKEPIVLPSKFPNLLVNGSTGIAVGMATNIPPHNIKEVSSAVIKLIEDPEVPDIDLYKEVQGPDFPTGGMIQGKSGIMSAYTTGRGKALVKARMHDEEKGNHKRIIITEIPYMVNKSDLVMQIASCVKEKRIEGISDLRDESDRKGMRIVVELKKDANADVIKNQLYSYTRLQETFGIILLGLVKNQPKILTLRQMLTEFLLHRRVVVRKRTEYDLRKAEERAHILEGLLIALENIDEAIELIKKAESANDAKELLMKKYALSEIQSQAILDMKLQKIAKMETNKIKEEHSDLKTTISNLKHILSDEKEILTIIKQEQKDIIEKYGDERKTTILEQEDESFEIEDLIPQEDVVITVSNAGYVKRMPLDTYKTQRRGGVGVIGAERKEEDFIERVFVANTHSYLLIFTDKGIVHWLKVYRIPEASRHSKGKAIINLIDLGNEGKISAIIAVPQFDEDHYLLTATKNGIVKKTSLSAYSKPRRGGIIALTLDENDSLVRVALTDGTKQVLLATKKGLACKFNETDARPIGRTSRGVTGIRLNKGDEVVDMILVDDETNVLTLTTKGYGKQTKASEYRLINRGGKGVRNINLTDKNGEVVTIKSVKGDEDLMLITKNGMVIRTSLSQVSVIGRNTQGVRLIRLREGDELVSAAKILSEEEVEEEVEQEEKELEKVEKPVVKEKKETEEEIIKETMKHHVPEEVEEDEEDASDFDKLKEITNLTRKLRK